MQILVTDSSNKQLVSIEHKLVMLIRRSPGGLLTSDILTGMNGPTGPMALQVLESPEEVGRMVNNAIAMELDKNWVDVSLGFSKSPIAST